jgi:hypothetical protein
MFGKRATNYRVLLREMTYTDKASYGSSPPCTNTLTNASACAGKYILFHSRCRLISICNLHRVSFVSLKRDQKYLENEINDWDLRLKKWNPQCNRLHCLCSPSPHICLLHRGMRWRAGVCVCGRLLRQMRRTWLIYMGWLCLVCSFKLQASFAEYTLFYWALLQKRPVILRKLLIEATPYLIWFNFRSALGKCNYMSMSHIQICVSYICQYSIQLYVNIPYTTESQYAIYDYMSISHIQLYFNIPYTTICQHPIYNYMSICTCQVQTEN